MSSDTLQIKITNRPQSRISIALEVPAERCKASYENALTKLSRSLKLPGFRKGKIPRAVIIQRLGTEQIKASALENLIDGVWREAIKEKSLEPLSEPEIEGGIEDLFKQFNPNEILKLTLETDVPPSPKLKNTQGIEVQAEKIIFEEKRIDELIEDSRKQLATLVPIEGRAASLGDIAEISFTGKYVDDNSEIKGGNSESMNLDLEEGKMIPGFVEGIVGMLINDDKTLICQFPEDYPQEEARGREAKFNVKLKDLKTRELPEINDEFAKQASDKENMKELREDLEQKLKEDADRTNTARRQEALLEGLIKELEVDLPKALVDQEIRNIIEQTARRFAEQGMDVKSIFTDELVKSLMESSREEAENNLKKSLALKELTSKENIEINEKEIESKTKDLTKDLSKNQKIDQQRLREAVCEELTREKGLLWLEENVKVIETSPENKSKSSKAKKNTTEQNSKKPIKKTKTNDTKN